jgi:hypothetical protein
MGTARALDPGSGSWPVRCAVSAGPQTNIARDAHRRGALWRRADGNSQQEQHMRPHDACSRSVSKLEGMVRVSGVAHGGGRGEERRDDHQLRPVGVRAPAGAARRTSSSGRVRAPGHCRGGAEVREGHVPASTPPFHPHFFLAHAPHTRGVPSGVTWSVPSRGWRDVTCWRAPWCNAPTRPLSLLPHSTPQGPRAMH